MVKTDTKEKYIRKDSWIKEIRKSCDPEFIAKALRRRIKTPNDR